MAIPDGYIKNFETIKRAFANGDVALVECFDRVTKKPVYTICAVDTCEQDHRFIVPFAKMFDGNPYEELDPPTVDPPDAQLEGAE